MDAYVSHHPLPEKDDGLVYHAPAFAKVNVCAPRILTVCIDKNPSNN
jgi:hypothetical protein